MRGLAVPRRLSIAVVGSDAVRPINQYGEELLATLRRLIRAGRDAIVLLMPGVYRSAYRGNRETP